MTKDYEKDEQNIQIKHLPESLIALRKELTLPVHKDIAKKAMNEGRNFEECLGIIATELGIILDGMYDVPELCDVLVTALQKRATIYIGGGIDSGETRDPRLVSVSATLTRDAIILDDATPGGIIVGQSTRVDDAANDEKENAPPAETDEALDKTEKLDD